MKSEKMNDKILDFTIQINIHINFTDQDLKTEESVNNLNNMKVLIWLKILTMEFSEIGLLYPKCKWK